MALQNSRLLFDSTIIFLQSWFTVFEAWSWWRGIQTWPTCSTHTCMAFFPSPTSLRLRIYDNPQLILFTLDILKGLSLEPLEYPALYLDSTHLFSLIIKALQQLLIIDWTIGQLLYNSFTHRCYSDRECTRVGKRNIILSIYFHLLTSAKTFLPHVHMLWFVSTQYIIILCQCARGFSNLIGQRV